MEEFLKACGATGPLQLVIEHRGLIAMRWGAHQPFALVGRDPSADVSLDHPRVDPYHAYLQVIGGGVYWVDLESQTGTRWEDGPARSGWLSPPHGIGIGPYVIQLAPDDRGVAGPAVLPDPLASRSKTPDDLPRVMLEFRQESAKPIRWRMRHLLTLVGSSPLCKVRLSSPGILPFHCSLLRTATGLWVVNLLGHGGVTVNGASVRAARLEDGDELKVGDILIRVLFLAPVTAVEGGTPAEGGMARQALPAPTPLSVPTTGLAVDRPEAVWMAPGPEAGRLLAERVSGEGEISASVLAMVLDQFGQMQQQFLDQFQQTTLMMFRALGTMHRDQMEELREKLDSLHQIGENLQAFQDQLENGVAPGPLPAAPRGENPALPRTATAGPPNGGTGGPGQGRLSAAPAGRESRSTAGNGTDPLREKMRSIVDQPNIPGENVHEWLIGRIAAIEDEQRTRWQKILDMVRGR
jgi:pSer/pThr/pTyr-binding forkhead associated (FHA) protein